MRYTERHAGKTVIRDKALLGDAMEKLAQYEDKEEKDEAESRGFFSNPENAYHCKNCPDNKGYPQWPENKLPCGQFHCWVTLTCGRE